LNFVIAFPLSFQNPSQQFLSQLQQTAAIHLYTQSQQQQIQYFEKFFNLVIHVASHSSSIPQNVQSPSLIAIYYQLTQPFSMFSIDRKEFNLPNLEDSNQNFEDYYPLDYTKPYQDDSLDNDADIDSGVVDEEIQNQKAVLGDDEFGKEERTSDRFIRDKDGKDIIGKDVKLSSAVGQNVPPQSSQNNSNVHRLPHTASSPSSTLPFNMNKHGGSNTIGKPNQTNFLFDLMSININSISYFSIMLNFLQISIKKTNCDIIIKIVTD
jgi:hypothetical protein